MATLTSGKHSMKNKIVGSSCAFLLFLGASMSQAAEIVVYDPGTLIFGTSNQSMWETGTGIAPQEVNYSSSWSEDDNKVNLGEIVGVENFQVPGTGGSVPNPARITYDAALSTCKGLGYSTNQCKNGTGAIYAPCLLRNADGDCILGGDKLLDGIPGLGSAPSSTIPNPVPAQFIDTRTGFEGGLSTSGSIGIFSNFGANGGTVDADFEYSVSLSYPNQVIAGEFFSLNPASSLNAKDMTTFFPQLTGKVTSSFKTRITGFSKVCGIFNEGGTGCTTTSEDWVNVDIDPEILEMNTSNLPPDTASLFGLDDLAFDATRLRVFLDLGETGPTLSLPGFPRPLLAINVGDVTLDAPSTDLGNSASFENGKLVSSSHLTNIVALNVDNDARATMAGVLPPLGAVSNIGPLTFRGDVVDIGYGLTIDMNQDFELTPTLMVRLDFDGPVLVRDYEQPGIRAITSIVSPFGQLPDIALIDNQKVHVSPTFFMQAEFDNNSEMIFNLTVFRDILNGTVTMLGLELAADCITCGQENLAEFGKITLFDNSFDLGGFNEIPGQPFQLITNNPPELRNVPDNTVIEGNVTGGASSDHDNIETFLNQVTATDEEDDDSTLVVTTSPTLPQLLTLDSTTTVTFSVTDSFGDTTTAQATLTVVDTTPPVLALDDLTVVAEGPLGTPVPDAAMTINDWLSELVVQDIVDPSPVVDSLEPTFLDLGTTSIGFVATDASGNQSSIDPMVYVKAPFSLFAENSIRIDKHTVVESGVVAVPEFTPGPWLSKDGQVDIDKYSVLDFAAPLYSDSINLENNSWVASAFFNHVEGKGEIGTENAFLPGIYFPLNGLPGYGVGEIGIEVSCSENKDKSNKSKKSKKSKKSDKSIAVPVPVDCLESGMVLESGNYNTLELNKGKGQKDTTLFLSGGVYSFGSLAMEQYTSIIALDSSLILVAGTVETDKGASIVPADSNAEEIEIIIMVDGIDVLNGSRDDDDDDDEENGKSKKEDDDINRKKLKIKEFAVTFDRDNEIHATVFAPNGSIELGKRSLVEGALIAENLDIGESVVIRFNGDI
jgi:hypothetical protein